MLSKKNKIGIGVSTIVIILLGIVTMIYFNMNSEIDSFSKYIENYKVRAEQYILGENEEQYDELMEKSKQAIENKDKKNIDELKAELEELENKIIENNINNLKKKVEDIKAIKVEKEEKKEEISTKLKEVEILIEEKKFKKANEELDVLNKNIKDILAAIEQEYIKDKLIEIEKLISDEDLEKAKIQISTIQKMDLNDSQKKEIIKLVELISEKQEIRKIEGTYLHTRKNKNGAVVYSEEMVIEKIDDTTLEIGAVTNRVSKIMKDSEWNFDIENASKEDVDNYADYRGGGYSGKLVKIRDNMWSGKVYNEMTYQTVEITFIKNGLVINRDGKNYDFVIK